MAQSHDEAGKLPIAKALRNVFMDGNYSDLTVICKNRSFKAHKVVVCTQSDFFKRACEGGFKESQENKITLPDDDPDVVEVMLHYFYHFDYCDVKQGAMAPLLLNLHLFDAADKYFVQPLKDIATEKFNRRAYESWALDEFAEALEKLYESTYAGGPIEILRLILMEVVKEHDKELFNEDAHSRFQVAAISSPAFLFDYVRSMTAEPSTRPSVASTLKLNWYKCPGVQCQKHAAIFGVRNTVPSRFKFNCPLKCTVDQNQRFWDQFKTIV